MFDLWREDLTDERRNEMLDRAAKEIKRRKMEVPAAMFLEMHKPLSFVTSQAAIAFSPFIVPFLGFDRTNELTQLLSDRNNIEALLNRIESIDPDEPGSLEDSCSTTTQAK